MKPIPNFNNRYALKGTNASDAVLYDNVLQLEIDPTWSDSHKANCYALLTDKNLCNVIEGEEHKDYGVVLTTVGALSDCVFHNMPLVVSNICPHDLENKQTWCALQNKPIPFSNINGFHNQKEISQ